jgi:signal transduction histidine kinase
LTREHAIELLTSDSPHTRLQAARCLASHAEPGDISILQNARRTEQVGYVRTSLDSAIRRLSDLPDRHGADANEQLDVPQTIKKHLYRQAVERITGLLLHEIASPIGLAKRTASREIANYGSSRTKHHLENVERIFEAIEQLKGATAVPHPEQFDLSELLADIVSAEANNGQASQVSLHGPRPMMVMSDPTLVRLAVCNGVRNAFEATTAASRDEPHLIVITWGQTDIDYWVAILDRGTGIVGPLEAAFEIGKTTKKGHSGFGLAIARQAIESLGGTVTLSPAAQGGTRYEARWER